MMMANIEDDWHGAPVGEWDVHDNTTNADKLAKVTPLKYYLSKHTESLKKAFPRLSELTAAQDAGSRNLGKAF